MQFIKPKIIISKCLEFEPCRYDGQIINNEFIKKLKKFIDFEPICPEVEIGMGIPRDPIKIINNKKEKLLYQEKTGRDYSDTMNKFSEKYLKEISNIDGFILKSKSPSCGVNSAKMYSNKENPIVKELTSGYFSKRIIAMYPNHPIEEEVRLNNIFIREHFYTSIFTIADFKQVDDFDKLYKYHAKHKYLFMSYDQTLMTQMGNIAANKNYLNINKVLKKYHQSLLILFSKQSRIPTNINTQMHVMGYFKKMLTSKEKNHFINTLEQYRNKKISISGVNNILISWVNRFGNKYLENQSFFNPFPTELIMSDKSRFI